MAKILIHSNCPWVTTGYGQQTALWAPRLASLGHEVAISGFYGLQGGRSVWRGHTVYPGGMSPYGDDVLPQHARHFGADLVITLMDAFVLDPGAVRQVPCTVAHWMPVDCHEIVEGGLPIGKGDLRVLEKGGGQPIAMTRFGQDQLRKAGFDPLYVPHGIDTALFSPPEDRTALRQQMGVDDRFVIVINAANAGQERKAFPEQFAAFARLRQKHPDALLMLHTLRFSKSGIPLADLVDSLGIAEAVQWADQDAYVAGTIGPQVLAAMYGAADLLSGCSMAEGFGLPVLEAEACGTPTVVTDGSAMAEVGSGWKVPGQPWWHMRYGAWWMRPDTSQIWRAYEKAYERGASYQAKASAAREHALAYDADRVLTEFWKPVLERLEAA